MSRCKTCLFAFALTICATPSLAGTLASDGSSYLGTWNGSTPYVGVIAPADLYGHVDYAVYGPGTFPGAFSGYAPNPAHFVYAYQIFEEGPAPLSLYSHLLVNVAANPGTFTGGGVSGDSPINAPGVLIAFDSVTWEFAGIPAGGTSVGLAFSSPNAPIMGAGVALDDGEVAPVIPVPTPGSFIPEPATWVLMIGGFLGFVVASWRRRVRRV